MKDVGFDSMESDLKCFTIQYSLNSDCFMAKWEGDMYSAILFLIQVLKTRMEDERRATNTARRENRDMFTAPDGPKPREGMRIVECLIHQPCTRKEGWLILHPEWFEDSHPTDRYRDTVYHTDPDWDAVTRALRDQ